jgi:hypothetical protein
MARTRAHIHGRAGTNPFDMIPHPSFRTQYGRLTNQWKSIIDYRKLLVCVIQKSTKQILSLLPDYRPPVKKNPLKLRVLDACNALQGGSVPV